MIVFFFAYKEISLIILVFKISFSGAFSWIKSTSFTASSKVLQNFNCDFISILFL